MIAWTWPSISSGGGSALPPRTIGYSNESDPRKLAANQRSLVQEQGDRLSTANQQQAQQGEQNYQGIYDFLNPTMSQMALGQGGYSPEEQAQIMDSERLNSLPTSADQLQSNFLTQGEQQGMMGDTGSYTKYFNPDQMNQNLEVAQGKQGQAVDDLQQNLRTSIDADKLRQSNAYQQDSENQLSKNQGDFNTTLGAVGNNVRGVIDPNAMRQSDTANTLEQQSSKANAAEQLSPEQQQQIITAAGVTSGLKDQAAADEMERRANAAGASPMGVGAYRARMARQAAQDAGTSMTEARARVAENAATLAQQAEAQRMGGATTAEGQRLGAQQNLTGLQANTEMGMGQEALQGEQALGQQALAQRNTEEQNRQGAEQFLTGANLQAATTGGQAGIQNAQLATGQGQQQGQYAATTGTGIAQAQDVANAQRAGQVAQNRQGVNVNNQNTAFNQGMGVSNAQSQRAAQVANTRLGKQDTGVNYYTGQENQQNANAQNAYGRQQQTYQTQTSGTNDATKAGLQASQTPSTFDKIMGGITGAAGAAASFLDDGGIITKPTTAVVGESGQPEWVGPARKAAGIASAFGQGMTPNQPRWAQSLQQLGQSGGKIKDAISMYRARKAAGDFKNDTPLNQGIDQAINSTPPQSAGPAPQIPDIGGSDASVPDYANEGKVVTRPTLMVLGEHENEAVVPLSYRPRAKTRPSMVA